MCAEANAAAVAAKGGIEAVVAAMRRHAGVADVAERGCGALMSIAVLGGWSAAVCARAAAVQGGAVAVAVRAAASARGAATCVRAVVCAVCRHAVGGRCTAGARACVRVGAQPWCSRVVCVCLRVRIDVGARVVCVSASPRPSTLLASMCCAHLT